MLPSFSNGIVDNEIMWNEATNTYICKDGTEYTDEQLDELLALESDWKQTLPPSSERYWLGVFPEYITGLRNHVLEARAVFEEPDKEVVEKLRKIEALTVSDNWEKTLALAKEVPIGELVKVRRDGKFLCLFHNEKSPSCHWYKNKNRFHCFGCAEHGDVIDIAMKQWGYSMRDAVQRLIRL